MKKRWIISSVICAFLFICFVIKTKNMKADLPNPIVAKEMKKYYAEHNSATTTAKVAESGSTKVKVGATDEEAKMAHLVVIPLGKGKFAYFDAVHNVLSIPYTGKKADEYLQDFIKYNMYDQPASAPTEYEGRTLVHLIWQYTEEK